MKPSSARVAIGGGHAEVENPAADQPTVGWMQDIAPYGIFTTDAALRITSWNQWLVTHSGLTSHQVVGRALVEVYPELGERKLTERFLRALAGEIIVLSAALHKHLLRLPVTVPESGLPHMLQTARIAPLPRGEAIVGTVTIIEDVTQREFQAAILHRQQELDRLLSNSLAALLQAADPAEEIPGIFAAVCPALGLDAYACFLIRPHSRQLHLASSSGLPPRQREELTTVQIDAKDEQLLRGGSVTNCGEVGGHGELMRSTGLKALHCCPLTVAERIIGFVTFGSYERLSIASADINILLRITRYVAIALDRALRQSATLAASRAKDDFLAALSHELRTPLNPVLLTASDAADNDDYPPAAREAFRSIEKNALLEARLIDDLLDLTRIEHNKLNLELAALDLHAVLQDSITTVRPDAAERKLRLHLDLQANASTMTGDAARLQQVFWNVLKNSVKFTPVGGDIWVVSRFDPDTNHISIEFRDSGIGMEEHEVTRIFDAFAQGDHADKGGGHRFGGLGLGLAISRKLVELHAGEIRASSAGKGLGSTFTIRLPLLPSTHQVRSRSGHLSGNGGSDGSGTPPPFSRKILLVEDHEPTRAPLAQLLKRRGYEVVATGSCSLALEEAAKARFDLVLSDIGLPDGDGFELMAKLRDQYGMKGIALTGYGMEEDVLRSGRSGFIAHLTKPVSVGILDRALAQALPVSPGN